MSNSNTSRVYKLLTEIHMEQTANQQSLLNLQQSTNQLEQLARELYNMTSTNGTSLCRISDTIKTVKMDMLAMERWNQLQQQQINQQLHQQSIQFQEQFNYYAETMTDMRRQMRELQNQHV